MSLKLQIVSDLHIEAIHNRLDNTEICPNPFDYITPSADILILAGDIGSLYKYNQLHTFLSKLCVKFKFVLYVPGNWEYYKLHECDPLALNTLVKRLQKLEKSIPNLHILNKTSVLIGNVCIAGCTLWSDLQCEIPKFIVKINEMTTTLYKDLFEDNLKYLKKMVNYTTTNNLKLVVVTHHCPTYKCLENSGGKRDRFSSLYTSEIQLLESGLINTWICGHTHSNFDFFIESGTHIVSNQKGKPRDKIVDFKKDLVVDVK